MLDGLEGAIEKLGVKLERDRVDGPAQTAHDLQFEPLHVDLAECRHSVLGYESIQGRDGDPVRGGPHAGSEASTAADRHDPVGRQARQLRLVGDV
jgi:hypothetical protein